MSDDATIPWNPVPFSSLNPVQKEWVYERRDELIADLISNGTLSDSVRAEWDLFGYDPIQPNLREWLEENGISLDLNIGAYPDIYSPDIIQAQQLARSQAQVSNILKWIEEDLDLPITGNLDQLVEHYRDKYYTAECLNYHDSGFCFVTAAKVGNLSMIQRGIADYAKGKLDRNQILLGWIEAMRAGEARVVSELLPILETIDLRLRQATIDIGVTVAAENKHFDLVKIMFSRASDAGKVAIIPALISDRQFDLLTRIQFSDLQNIQSVIETSFLRLVRAGDIDGLEMLKSLPTGVTVNIQPGLELASKLGMVEIIRYLILIPGLDLGIGMKLAVIHQHREAIENGYLSIPLRDEVYLDGIVESTIAGYSDITSILLPRIQGEAGINDAFHLVVLYNQISNLPEILPRVSTERITAMFSTPIYYQDSILGLGGVIDLLSANQLNAILPSVQKYGLELYQRGINRWAEL